MLIRRLAICVVASLILIVLPLPNTNSNNAETRAIPKHSTAPESKSPNTNERTIKIKLATTHIASRRMSILWSAVRGVFTSTELPGLEALRIRPTDRWHSSVHHNARLSYYASPPREFSCTLQQWRANRSRRCSLVHEVNGGYWHQATTHQ
jgi:hypothetical protein